MESQEIQVNIGTPQLEWEVDEYPQHQRSRGWYILAGTIGVGLVFYAIATANLLFAVIVLMGGIITLLSSFVKPDRVPVVITNTGVVIADMYYDFDAIRDFGIVYNPPDIKNLYFEFHSPWQPLVAIPLEDIDPNQVRDLLLPYCLENLKRVDETLTDVLRRMYKM